MTTFSTRKLHPLVAAISVAGAISGLGAIGGCSDSSSGGSAPLAEVSAATVSATMTEITDAVSNCESEDSVVAVTSLASETTSVVGGVVAVSRQVPEDSSEVIAMATTIVGSCDAAPGMVSVDSEHASGVTVYTLEFSDYCIDGPEGDTIYDGTVTTSENGTPTDSGPMVSSMDMSAKALTVQPSGASGDSYTVGFSSHTEYGTEYNAFYGPSVTPDADNPDLTTVKSLTAESATDGSVYKINGLDLVRTGSISSASVEITSGSYTNPEGERVDISTPLDEPITVNIVTGTFVDGVIELAGAEDSVAEISASTDRTVAVSVNGVSAATLNCSNTDAAVSDTADIVIDNLPVY